jgi:hypothetical protein
MIHLGNIIIAHSGLLLSIAGGCWLVAWALREEDRG